MCLWLSALDQLVSEGICHRSMGFLPYELNCGAVVIFHGMRTCTCVCVCVVGYKPDYANICVCM